MVLTALTPEGAGGITVNRRRFLAFLGLASLAIPAAAQAAPERAPTTWTAVDPMTVSPTWVGGELVSVRPAVPLYRVRPEDYGPPAVNPLYALQNHTHRGSTGAPDWPSFPLMVLTSEGVYKYDEWVKGGGARAFQTEIEATLYTSDDPPA